MVCLSSKLVQVIWCCVPFVAAAQMASQFEPPTMAESQQVNAQRLIIDIKRQQLQAAFRAEDAACYQRFAVNNCLQDTHARRTASLADLQRQDVFLNDQERKQRGAEEIRRIEAKQTAASQQELVERRAKAFAEYQARTQAIDQRQQLKASQTDAVAATAQATSNRLKVAELKAKAKQQKQIDAPQAVAKFQQRQAQAEKRRIEHTQQQAAKPITTATGLPVPP